MTLAAKNELQANIDKNQEEVRKLVLAGVEQAKQGKVQDFDAVFERLEKKYQDAML